MSGESPLLARRSPTHCESDTSVSCCALNDSSARPNEPCVAPESALPAFIKMPTFFLSIFDDIECGPIFDTSPWILELCFPVDVGAEFVRETVDADQRSAADGPYEALNGSVAGGG